MAGNITKRGENTWRVRVFLGRDEKGSQLFHSHTVHGTKKDAQAYLNRVLRDRDLGIWSEPSAETVRVYLRRWLTDAALPRIATSTATLYENYLTLYLDPGLGHFRLSKLTPLDIQGFYASLSTQLKPSSVRRLHGMLSSALNQAVKWNLIPRNPASLVDLPKVQKKEMHAFGPVEAAKFLAAAKLDKHAMLWAILISTGLRPGEAMALKWQDIDLKAGTLTVRRSLTWKAGGLFEFNEPKTTRSIRQLPLPAALIPEMKAHKAHVAEARLKAGTDWQDNDLVFPAALGRPLHKANLGRHLKAILKAANLPEDFRLYDLRHSCATLLLADGTHPKVVADRLGHASVTLTLDTYSHVTQTMQSEASKAMNRMLFESAN